MIRVVALLMVSLLSRGAFAAEPFDHSVWNALLSQHVLELAHGKVTQINYAGMAADKSKLQGYLNQLEQVPKKVFDSWGKQEQLAFLINAYNAWTVQFILTKYPDLESIKDLGSFFQSPWKKKFIPLLGETRSLDDIEHGLIRGSGRYNDPRIHFAVNCASIGCPALSAKAYLGETLDAQLEQAAGLFLADQTRNRFDGGDLALSSIFKWYRDDFEKGWRGAETLPQFIALYATALGASSVQVEQLRKGEIDIEFLKYDWRLNTVPE